MRLTTKLLYDLRHRGLAYSARFYACLGWNLLKYPVYAFKRDYFTFNGEPLQYWYHYYNITHITERVVEIPIVRQLLHQKKPARLLEVGNVLSHYFPMTHTIIDKYETNPKVINQDIVDFETTARFDAIVCISTLEHVGFEEAVKDPQKIGRAVIKMKSLLAAGGILIITAPFGWNPNMDSLITGGLFSDCDNYYFRRIATSQ